MKTSTVAYDLVKPGKIIIQAIQANLIYDDNLISKMDPYCKFVMGSQSGKTETCKNGGKHPYWSQVVSLHRTNETLCDLQMMNENSFVPIISSQIGAGKIHFSELGADGKVTKWFDLFRENKPVGKVLLNIAFIPDSVSSLHEVKSHLP